MAKTPKTPLAKSRISGPGSSAIKYDILTALLATANREDGTTARLALRLSLAITTRFNWQSGTMTIGLASLGRLWGVTERTAKREVAAMRSRKWIAVAVPAARGRVATYRLDFSEILRDTAGHWDAIGPDFTARMSGAPEPECTKPTGAEVIPFPPSLKDEPAEPLGLWSLISARLAAQDPSNFSAWFRQLEVHSENDNELVLAAPTEFSANYIRTHYLARLLAVLHIEDDKRRELKIVSKAPDFK